MAITLGIDLGTTKCAVVVYDTEQKKTLKAESASHHADISGNEKEAAEQDPSVIIDTAFSLIRNLPDEIRKQISKIGITGQMHSVLGWNNQEVFPLITWQDRRCGKLNLLESFSTVSGHRLYDGFGAATLARIGKGTEKLEFASTIMDYLGYCLTDNHQPVTDPSNAASWGIFDIHTGNWDFHAADALGISRRLLPEIRPSGSVIGLLSEEIAHKIGLSPQIEVCCSIGDNQASIIGTGEDFSSELYLTLGTGAQLSAVVNQQEMEQISDSNGIEIRPFINGRYLAVRACLCGGKAFSLIGETFQRWMNDFGIQSPPLNKILDMLDEAAIREFDSQRQELNVIPRYLGERGKENQRGTIQNISWNNFTPVNLAIQTASGIILNLKEDYPDFLLKNRKKILGSGNGIRKVQCIQKTIRQCFQQELVLVDTEEEAAGGAAKLTTMNN